MDKQSAAVFDGLQQTYTVAEAKREIDAILAAYAPECEILFGKTAAEIINSYKVNSRFDRYRICEIIVRTGLTGRDCENLAAEWMLHNAAWKAHVGRAGAKDVSLDYKRDPRAPVHLATELFDFFDIE